MPSPELNGEKDLGVLNMGMQLTPSEGLKSRRVGKWSTVPILQQNYLKALRNSCG